MAEDDEMMEAFVSSVILDSLKQSGDALSNEDLAWVDSCLVKDHEVSDESWNSLKDALLEILSPEPKPVYSASAPDDDSVGENDIEILPTIEEAGSAESPGGDDDDLAHTSEVDSTSDETVINRAFKSQVFADNVFLPTYVEGKEQETVGSIHDSGDSVYEVEQPYEDIFKVWDLDIPGEEDEDEDELIKQLNKALRDVSFESTQSTRGDSVAWKDVLSESIDDLVAGISDLSLTPILAEKHA